MTRSGVVDDVRKILRVQLEVVHSKAVDQNVGGTGNKTEAGPQVPRTKTLTNDVSHCVNALCGRPSSVRGIDQGILPAGILENWLPMRVFARDMNPPLFCPQSSCVV